MREAISIHHVSKDKTITGAYLELIQMSVA